MEYFGMRWFAPTFRRVTNTERPRSHIAFRKNLARVAILCPRNRFRRRMCRAGSNGWKHKLERGPDRCRQLCILGRASWRARQL